MFLKIGVFKNFSIFTGKYLSQSLFFKKTQVFSYEHFEIFKDNFFYRTTMVAVYVIFEPMSTLQVL